MITVLGAAFSRELARPIGRCVFSCSQSVKWQNLPIATRARRLVHRRPINEYYFIITELCKRSRCSIIFSFSSAAALRAGWPRKQQ